MASRLRESISPQQVRHMIARALPLLLSDATSRNPAEFLKAKHEIGLILTNDINTDIRLFRGILELVNAVRVTELVLIHLIPACDREFPFRWVVNYSENSTGATDLGRTISSGAIASHRVISTAQSRDHDTPEGNFIVQTIRRCLVLGQRVTDNIGELSGPNPIVSQLVSLLQAFAHRLRTEVASRPHLRPALEMIFRSRHIRPRVTWNRAVRTALRIAHHMENLPTGIKIGDKVSSYTLTPTSKLYEFWCFCELTARLIERKKFDVVQRSLLRAGDDSPVFAFGEGSYVFYEHRAGTFRLDDRIIRVERNQPLRGPEWIVLRGLRLRDSVIMDTKLYTSRSSSMGDAVNTYLLDYGIRTGVVFVSVPPNKEILSRPGLSMAERHIHESYFPLSLKQTIKRYDVYLIPREDRNDLNVDILDCLIERLGL